MRGHGAAAPQAKKGWDQRQCRWDHPKAEHVAFHLGFSAGDGVYRSGGLHGPAYTLLLWRVTF